MYTDSPNPLLLVNKLISIFSVFFQVKSFRRGKADLVLQRLGLVSSKTFSALALRRGAVLRVRRIAFPGDAYKPDTPPILRGAAGTVLVSTLAINASDCASI